MLSVETLQEYLNYSPETGVFTWIKSPSQAVRAGDVAGTLDKRGFVEIGLKGKIYKAHRLAFLLVNGVMPECRMRHRNHNHADNRFDNLRLIGSDLDARTLREELIYDKGTGSFCYRETGEPAGSNSSGYVTISVDGKYYPAHRLAWLYEKGEWPVNQIDHENAVKSDNRFDNLRPATIGQNRRNVGKSVKNTSGWKGVSWHQRIGKWQARISVGRKRFHLGYFDDLREAAEEYIFAALEHHGEYARFE